MANGITVKEAIENELEGKSAYTVNDTIKCIKHIASGIDNMACNCKDDKKNPIKRIDNLESEMKFHKRFLSAVWGLTGGVIVFILQYFYNKLGGK